MGRLTYIVRIASLSGEVLGRYQHPGPSEPSVGTLLDASPDLPAGPWRVSDVQTDASASANNVLVVEQIPAERNEACR